MPFPHSLFTLLLFSFSSSFSLAAVNEYSPSVNPSASSLLPSDAVSLLSFKTSADLDNKLLYALHEPFDYCQWQGVKCAQGRVVRFLLQGFGLRGIFSPNTLTRLDQLRVLSLRNNSLAGHIPDLSSLVNLKSLFLDHNHFSGSFPLSIISLHRLLILTLSHNNLTGPIPAGLNSLSRLSSLRLELNRFNGTVPPLNQSSLRIFNVSWNNLTGPIPVTPTLAEFDSSAFYGNPGLCGEIIHRACGSRFPFFGSPGCASAAAPLGQSAQSQGNIMVVTSPNRKNHLHKSIGLILGFMIGVLVLIASVLSSLALVRKSRKKRVQESQAMPRSENRKISCTVSPPSMEAGSLQARENREMGVKGKKMQEMEEVQKSGNLVFCCGEVQAYTLEQLMRASAELLGRGTIGTTYKAVLDNKLIVTVKRLDAGKTGVTSSQVFERHLEMVGGLRHPNLVPVRAYFQAKGERLVIYDYQPNGSLFNLIHGSRSTRAKPLHWTSCLKIAEDVAQGLVYIHQAARLIHGNLKSSNVLLGADFEACVTDYSLAFLADSSSSEDPDSAAYKAPETRNSGRRATSKSDVYTFGVLLLELLTGKYPSQHPFLLPTDVPEWVRRVRSDDGDEDRLQMLAEVACICSVTSPEQRPEMWQVLKMIQQIKETIVKEDNAAGRYE